MYAIEKLLKVFIYFPFLSVFSTGKMIKFVFPNAVHLLYDIHFFIMQEYFSLRLIQTNWNIPSLLSKI